MNRGDEEPKEIHHKDTEPQRRQCQCLTAAVPTISARRRDVFRLAARRLGGHEKHHRDTEERRRLFTAPQGQRRLATGAAKRNPWSATNTPHRLLAPQGAKERGAPNDARIHRDLDRAAGRFATCSTNSRRFPGNHARPCIVFNEHSRLDEATTAFQATFSRSNTSLRVAYMSLAVSPRPSAAQVARERLLRLLATSANPDHTT